MNQLRIVVHFFLNITDLLGKIILEELNNQTKFAKNNHSFKDFFLFDLFLHIYLSMS